MKNMFITCLIIFGLLLNAAVFAQKFVSREGKNFSLYKKKWSKEEVFAAVDTSKEILVVNSYFNVYERIFSLRNASKGYIKKYLYQGFYSLNYYKQKKYCYLCQSF